MKTLLPIIIICAVVFLLCFLVDTLLKALRPKSGLGKGVKFVRMPRRSFLFGMILLLFPVVAILFWLPKDEAAAHWLRRDLCHGHFAAVLFLFVLHPL